MNNISNVPFKRQDLYQDFLQEEFLETNQEQTHALFEKATLHSIGQGENISEEPLIAKKVKLNQNGTANLVPSKTHSDVSSAPKSDATKETNHVSPREVIEQENITDMDFIVKTNAAAIKAFDEMKQKGIMLNHLFMYNPLIQLTVLQKKPDASRSSLMENLLSNEVDLFLLNSVQYLPWLIEKAKLGEEAYKCFESMRAEKVPITMNTYNSLLSLLLQQNLKERINDLRKIMKEDGVPLNQESYTCFLNFLIKEKKPAHALNVLKEIRQKKFKVDQKTYASLILFLMNQKYPEKTIKETLQRVIDDELMFDERINSDLINFSLKNNGLEQACSIFKWMRDKGFKFNFKAMTYHL